MTDNPVEGFEHMHAEVKLAWRLNELGGRLDLENASDAEVQEIDAEFDQWILATKEATWDEVADMADAQGFPRSAAHIRENNPYRGNG